MTSGVAAIGRLAPPERPAAEIGLRDARLRNRSAWGLSNFGCEQTTPRTKEGGETRQGARPHANTRALHRLLACGWAGLREAGIAQCDGADPDGLGIALAGQIRRRASQPRPRSEQGTPRQTWLVARAPRCRRKASFPRVCVCSLEEGTDIATDGVFKTGGKTSAHSVQSWP